jgi:hypothetical protein
MTPLLIEDVSLILSRKPNVGIRRELARKLTKHAIIKSRNRIFTVLL